MLNQPAIDASTTSSKRCQKSNRPLGSNGAPNDELNSRQAIKIIPIILRLRGDAGRCNAANTPATSPENAAGPGARGKAAPVARIAVIVNTKCHRPTQTKPVTALAKIPVIQNFIS